jgi:ankyrin repeat protein
LLLDKHADFKLRDRSGSTALMLARAKKQLAAVKLLTKAGATQ